jgi:hypothetical protein
VNDGGIAPTLRASQQPGASAGETIYTTANHPWLTADRGWVAAGDLRPGEPVVTLSGGSGIVVWVQVVAGPGTMYNLTVAQDHTYAVGAWQWVVHNFGCGELIDQARQAAADESRRSATAVQATDISGEPVSLSQSVFTSHSPVEAEPFQDIIAQEQSAGAPHSGYAGGCGEVSACQELYANADALNGGSVDMGLYQRNSIGVCPTFQQILQRTATEINVAIHLEDGVHEPWDFLPEE